MYKKIVFFSILFLLILSSCSQNEPKIEYAKPVVVFEYSSKDVLPKQRFSVFVESESDVRRVESICIIDNESKKEWRTSDIQKIDVSGRMFVGNSNLAIPENTDLANGTYTFVYYTKDEKESRVDFTLDYDKEIKNIEFVNINKYVTEHRFIKNIVIYDSLSNCLYYGLETDSLKNEKDIIKQYKNAEYYAIVWVNSTNTIFCILPTQNINREK